MSDNELGGGNEPGDDEPSDNESSELSDERQSDGEIIVSEKV